MTQISIYVDQDDVLNEIDIDSAIAWYEVKDILQHISEKEVVESMDVDSLLEEIGKDRIKEYLEDAE